MDDLLTVVGVALVGVVDDQLAVGDEEERLPHGSVAIAGDVASYADGPLAGHPAVTRHHHGDGTAWYLATHPDQETLAALLHHMRREAGVTPEHEAPAGIEAVRRRGTEADYLFLIDHAGKGAEAPADGVELLTGTPTTGTVTVPPGGVAVVREPR
ncbi:beta-galactosidase trimerization domain-containing protein [Streptomyces sp. NBC_01604]|uniref:beta-galactosidase trimerization domain-containing protein n=1 Tax=Streptomyces sp. NBC_01604 TaxID=2975894 RepID=UPI00386F5F32